MTKYFVVFTEESTKDFGYYVDAESKEDAYMQAEKKYYSLEDPDSLNTSYIKTLGYEVEEA